MNTPWFDASTYGWIWGTVIGVGGGLYGALVGTLAPQGKCKRLILALHIALLGASLGLLAAGIVALAVKQPYGVWYSLLLPGCVGTIVLGSLTPVLLMRYRQADMQKSARAGI